MKTIKITFLALIIMTTYSLTAQVAITTDGSSANSKAMLDVTSTDKGMLTPRMTQAQRNNINPDATATGLLIYQTDGIPGFYYFNGSAWIAVSQIANGSETKVSAGTNITVTGIGTTANPYVVNATAATTLAIGNSHQGGKIFWLDATGQHGLIAATTDQSTGIQWFNGANKRTGTSGDGLYAGEMNTTMIVALQMTDNQSGNFAAKVCADFSVTDGGVTYGDWYLPSAFELNLLFLQKNAVGNFNSVFYWSSTEINDSFARVQSFANGSATSIAKNQINRVRAIRRF